MKKSTSGFTIVELLIVIVVIGILAAIVTVAYTGINSRANNAKTVAAVNSWVKAMRLYEVENGSLPAANSCLGTTTTYDGIGACWSSGWLVQSSFLTLMAPYIGSNYPEPDTSPINHSNTSIPYARGAFYYSTNPNGIDYIYMMVTGTNTCPSIGDGAYAGGSNGATGRYCIYALN